MHDEVSEKGFLLLDNKLKLVMFNSEAVKILAYPTPPESIKHVEVFLADRVKLNLIDGRSGDSLTFSKQFKSGNRRYVCRTFALQPNVSKEIAERLKISPNTVKAFVRLVMVKMGVTTRSAVVGKLFGSHLAGSPQEQTLNNRMFGRRNAD